MCGITGAYSRGRDASRRESGLVERMLDLQRHRGPDGASLHAEGPVVLGHRRLSIVDLSSQGAQPMPNEDRSVWVSFNGEIYNFHELRESLSRCGHCFRSKSDTEVLVHGYEQWGMDGLLERLRGMFAFALYDHAAWSKQGEQEFFFLVRDRMGIKPLYYGFDSRGETLFFASEVKALVRSGAIAHQLDTTALAAFLSLGSVPYPYTIEQHIKCLAPGSYLAIGRGGERLKRFWDIEFNANPRQENLDGLLTDCIERHLVADVPVGVFLSGGVDSGAIAALASQTSHGPVQTLTISFPGSEFDEAGEARQFASLIGSEHHEIPVTAAGFLSEIPKFLSSMDQPTADGVNTHFVSGAARQIGLKVVLSGLGGDEVFGGYSHFRDLVSGSGALGTFARAPLAVRHSLGAAAEVVGKWAGKENWQRFGYRRNRGSNESFYLLVRGFFPPAQVRELTGASDEELHTALESAFTAVRPLPDNGSVDPERFQYLEMRRYLHDQLLRDSDVFSMAQSIELRVPLVDHEVVQAGCDIPERRKIEAGVNKPRLVESVPGGLLLAAARRPKRGFSFPFQSWLSAHAQDLESLALTGTCLEKKAVRQCWDRFKAGRLHWSRAWSTVVAANLCRN